jgi:hypothetical protein
MSVPSGILLYWRSVAIRSTSSLDNVRKRDTCCRKAVVLSAAELSFMALIIDINDAINKFSVKVNYS